MTSRVFVVQQTMERDPRTGDLRPKFDFSSAGDHGDLVYLLGPSAAPWGSTVVPELEGKLADFDDQDHLLLVGNPVLIGLAFALAADANDGRVSVLQWDGRARRYAAVRCAIPSWDLGE